MNDKKFSKLKRTIQLKMIELNDLNEIYFNQTGNHFSGPLPVVPNCPVCGKEMSKTSSGEYICSIEYGWYDMPEDTGYYWRRFMDETPELCIIVAKTHCNLVIFPERETFTYLEKNDNIYYQKVKSYDLPV